MKRCVSFETVVVLAVVQVVLLVERWLSWDPLETLQVGEETETEVAEVEVEIDSVEAGVGIEAVVAEVEIEVWDLG